MATFNERQMIDEMIRNNGWLDSCMDDRDAPDNPPAVRIVEYDNAYGKTAWGVVFDGERNQFKYDLPTEYVRNPRVIWKRT